MCIKIIINKLKAIKVPPHPPQSSETSKGDPIVMVSVAEAASSPR
jgi:hypothetical protein